MLQYMVIFIYQYFLIIILCVYISSSIFSIFSFSFYILQISFYILYFTNISYKTKIPIEICKIYFSCTEKCSIWIILINILCWHYICGDVNHVSAFVFDFTRPSKMRANYSVLSSHSDIFWRETWLVCAKCTAFK